MANRFSISVEEGMETPSWINDVEPYLQKALLALGYDDAEISVLFCTDAFIQELNKQYRNIDAPTDVLSFENGSEYEDEEGTKWFVAGDIAISLETLPKNAEYFGVSEDEELKRLLMHGMLHLNGWDHGEEHVEKGVVPTDEMLRLQEETLPQFLSDKIIK